MKRGPKTKSKPISKRPRAGTDNDWAETFITEIACGKRIIDATKKAKVSMTAPYQRRLTDLAFKTAWDEAAKIKADLLEYEAMRRAYHGVLKPVYQRGVRVGCVREYSDTILMKLLSGNMPEKYSEKRSDVIVNNNTNVVNVFDDIERDIRIICADPAADSCISADGTAEPLDAPQTDGTETTSETNRLPDAM